MAKLSLANGYAVLLSNPRGSSGYARKFCAAIYADWGNKGGWSYGGISTDFIIAQTQRLKAAISGEGVALFASFYGHNPYQRDYDIGFGALREQLGLELEASEN